MLFDTGYAPRFLDATRALPALAYRWVTPVALPEDEPAIEQLRSRGVAAGDVRHLIVSHFHADHIAGLRDFPRARVHATRAAWASVRGLRGVRALRHAFLPALMPDDIEARLSWIDDRPQAPLPEPLAALGPGRDLFGDERIVAFALPGHAAGQVGALVRRDGALPLALVADAAWSVAGLRENAPPWALATAFLGDTPTYLRTFGLLRDALTAGGVSIAPSHCAEALARETAR